MRNWEEGALSPELLKAVQKVGYKKPSPIQMAAIPLGLQQRDVIGIAETGMFFSQLEMGFLEMIFARRRKLSQKINLMLLLSTGVSSCLDLCS
jgi:superfamily II DNA/RNA helicase